MEASAPRSLEHEGSCVRGLDRRVVPADDARWASLAAPRASSARRCDARAQPAGERGARPVLEAPGWRRDARRETSGQPGASPGATRRTPPRPPLAPREGAPGAASERGGRRQPAGRRGVWANHQLRLARLPRAIRPRPSPPMARSHRHTAHYLASIARPSQHPSPLARAVDAAPAGAAQDSPSAASAPAGRSSARDTLLGRVVALLDDDDEEELKAVLSAELAPAKVRSRIRAGIVSPCGTLRQSCVHAIRRRLALAVPPEAAWRAPS